MISLTSGDLAAAAAVVVGLAVATRLTGLGVSRQLLVLAARATAQLLLLGLVLRFVLGSRAPAVVAVLALVMLAVAAREVRTRQAHPLAGRWGYLAGALAMFLSSFLCTGFALAVVLGPDPWWAPRFSIPLLGMLLGNTMNGVSLASERLTESVVRGREVIEQRLALGESREDAVSGIAGESARAGLIPIFNAMAAAGVVSLPGMMTGQILAGAPVMEAVRYQILIILLIAAGTGFGVLAAVRVTARRLFDDRHRLRLDRLSGG